VIVCGTCRKNFLRCKQFEQALDRDDIGTFGGLYTGFQFGAVRGDYQLGKSQADRFFYARFDSDRRTAFSRQTDFSERDKIVGDRNIAYARDERERKCQVDRRVIELKSADYVDVHILCGKPQSQPLFEYRKQQAQTVVVDAVDRALG